MKDIKLGDVTVKDTGPLGTDFYIDGKRVMWINRFAEEQLMKWLSDKKIEVISEGVSKEMKNYDPSKSSGPIGPCGKDNPPHTGEKE